MTSLFPGPELLLGVPELDRDHAEILALAHGIRSSVDRAAPQAALLRSLDSFGATVATHFSFEERMMEQSAYPGRAGHALEHFRLLRQLDEVRDEFAGGTIEACGALALFIEVWSRSHIAGPDRQFAAHLKPNAE